VHAAPVIYTDNNSDQIIFTLFAKNNELSLHKITASADGGITDTTSIEIPGLSTDEQHYKAHQLALGNHNDQLALYITDLSNGLTKINAVNGNVIETKK
tara:strand:- start:2559 stop:2855 length:297 start_codon:yes stop_codon:yes gene_type:complete